MWLQSAYLISIQCEDVIGPRLRGKVAPRTADACPEHEFLFWLVEACIRVLACRMLAPRIHLIHRKIHVTSVWPEVFFGMKQTQYSLVQNARKLPNDMENRSIMIKTLVKLYIKQNSLHRFHKRQKPRCSFWLNDFSTLVSPATSKHASLFYVAMSEHDFQLQNTIHETIGQEASLLKTSSLSACHNRQIFIRLRSLTDTVLCPWMLGDKCLIGLPTWPWHLTLFMLCSEM